MDSLEQFTTRIELIHSQLLPVLQMLVSSMGSAVFIMTAKLLTRLKSPQVVYYRSLTMLCINTLLIWYNKVEVYHFSPAVKSKLISRGIFGAIGASLIFEGLKYISLSESLVLMRTSPLWTALFVIFISKQEKFSLTLFVTMFMGFVGVLLVARPPQIIPFLTQIRLVNYQTESKNEDPNFRFGVVLTLIGAISISMITIVTSSLVKQTNNLAVIQYNTMIQLVVGVLTPYFYGEEYAFIQINLEELLIILIMGVISFGAQFLQNKAMVKGKLTLMSMIPQTSVVWALLLDITVMNADLSICGLLGSMVIVFSLIILVFEKSKQPSQKKPSLVLSNVSL